MQKDDLRKARLLSVKSRRSNALTLSNTHVLVPGPVAGCTRAFLSVRICVGQVARKCTTRTVRQGQYHEFRFGGPWPFLAVLL